MPRRRWLARPWSPRRIGAVLAAGLIVGPLLAGLIWFGRELLRPIPPTATPEPPRLTVPPTPLGGGGLIAFESQREGNLDIWIMRPDGADQRNLTRHPAQDYAPAWSPDGRRLAFISDRADAGPGPDLYVMDAGGEQVTALTRGANLAAPVEWSPDGARLLARQAVGLNLRLFVVNVDGSGGRVRTVVPAAAEEFDLAAHWSPDGSRIAALRRRAAGLGLSVLNEQLDVLQILEAAPGTDVETLAWSPDSRRLAYTTSRRDAAPAAELRLADLETGETRVIRRFEGASGFHGMAWSPDGRRLAVAWASPDVEGQHLRVMWTDGSGLAAVTAPPGSHPEARWSPDSRWLVYAAFLPFPLTPAPEAAPTTYGYSYIYAVEVERLLAQPGEPQPHRLTYEGQDSQPAWQP